MNNIIHTIFDIHSIYILYTFDFKKLNNNILNKSVHSLNMSRNDKLNSVTEMNSLNELIIQIQKRLFDFIHKKPIIFRENHYNNMFANMLEICEKVSGSLSNFLSADNPENYFDFDFENELINSNKIDLNESFASINSQYKSMKQVDGINYNNCSSSRLQSPILNSIDETLKSSSINGNDRYISNLINTSDSFKHARSQSHNINTNNNDFLNVNMQRRPASHNEMIIYLDEDEDEGEDKDISRNSFNSQAIAEYKTDTNPPPKPIKSTVLDDDDKEEFTEIVKKKKKKSRINVTTEHFIEIRDVMELKSLKDSELTECHKIKNIDSFDGIKIYTRYIGNSKLVPYKYRGKYYIADDHVLYTLENNKLVPGKFRGQPQIWTEQE